MEEQKKLKVCVSCRVSSKKAEQATSLDNQKIYYTHYCEQHKDWEFNPEEDIFSDSFTGTKLLRPNFSKLLKELGIDLVETNKKFSVEILDYPSKYDLVILKSTSRLARNLDVHSLISKLKQKKTVTGRTGVGIFFESINKSTLSADDKIVIDVMLSLDAEYSASLSRKMKVSYGQSQINRNSIFGEAHWGYVREGSKTEAILKPKNQEYANIIKRIYEMYHYEKMGFQRIATYLKKNTEFRSDEKMQMVHINI